MSGLTKADAVPHPEQWLRVIGWVWLHWAHSVTGMPVGVVVVKVFSFGGPDPLRSRVLMHLA